MGIKRTSPLAVIPTKVGIQVKRHLIFLFVLLTAKVLKLPKENILALQFCNYFLFFGTLKQLLSMPSVAYFLSRTLVSVFPDFS